MVWLFPFSLWNKDKHLEVNSIEDKTLDTIFNAVVDSIKNLNMMRLFSTIIIHLHMLVEDWIIFKMALKLNL